MSVHASAHPVPAHTGVALHLCCVSSAFCTTLLCLTVQQQDGYCPTSYTTNRRQKQHILKPYKLYKSFRLVLLKWPNTNTFLKYSSRAILRRDLRSATSLLKEQAYIFYSLSDKISNADQFASMLIFMSFTNVYGIVSCILGLYIEMCLCENSAKVEKKQVYILNKSN